MRTAYYREVVVRLVPARSDSSGTSSRRSSREMHRAYDVLLYADQALEGLEHRDAPPPGQPKKVAGLELIAVEHIKLKPERYEEYLAAFFEGEKAPYMMRERLLETMSSGLELLFGGQPLASVPVRLWWDCSEVTELVDLPWELLSLPGRNVHGPPFSFVRGRPRDISPPPTPVDGPLRLAVIFDPARPPYPILEAAESVPGLEVIPLTGRPRDELLTAAREGFEMVHVLADGFTSLACDGILYFGHDPESPEMSAGELSAHLRGSRVTVLALTPPDSLSDTIDLAGRQVPSVYRSYAYLGSTDQQMPNIVAPLGPTFYYKVETFWREFYDVLTKTNQIEEALWRAQSNERLPMALFLRQRHHHLFRPGRTSRGDSGDSPAQAVTELQLSRDLTERLAALSANSDALPKGVLEFLNDAPGHQSKLQATLDSMAEVEAALDE